MSFKGSALCCSQLLSDLLLHTERKSKVGYIRFAVDAGSIAYRQSYSAFLSGGAKDPPKTSDKAPISKVTG